MWTQTSKAALRSKLQGELVVTSTRAEKARVSARLNQLYGATLRQGEEPHPWDFLQESNARILELSTAEVLAADDRHRRNLVAASQLRQERRRLVRALEGRIRKLRLVVTGHYGPEALALVGLETPPADSLDGLTQQAQDVLRRLRDPVRELPPPRPGLPPLDRIWLADGMEPDVRALTSVMAALVEARKRIDRSLVAKREALERHHERYLNVARIQEAYYRLAGLGELAERIRPFARSRRRPAETAAATPPQRRGSGEGPGRAHAGGGAAGARQAALDRCQAALDRCHPLRGSLARRGRVPFGETPEDHLD